MTYVRLGSLLAAVIVVSMASVALAERADCDITSPTGVTCPPRTSCSTRATCISGPGTEDATCQNIVTIGGAARECMPDCTTLFGCAQASDCPTIHGIPPICAPTTMPGLPFVCAYYATATSTTPPDQQITYCVPNAMAGNHIAASDVANCHRLAGNPSVFTDDYYRGDCDGDGCPNGHDTNPCMATLVGTSCTPLGPTPFESPFCAPLPAIACSVSGSQLSCGDARPCRSDASALPCAPASGTCEAGWSDVPRCRPSCSTLFLCATGTRPGGGGPHALPGLSRRAVLMPPGQRRSGPS